MFQRGYKTRNGGEEKKNEEKRVTPRREAQSTAACHYEKVQTEHANKAASTCFCKVHQMYLHSHTPSLAPLLFPSFSGSGSGRSSRRCRCELSFLLGGVSCRPPWGCAFSLSGSPDIWRQKKTKKQKQGMIYSSLLCLYSVLVDFICSIEKKLLHPIAETCLFSHHFVTLV